MRPFLLSCCLLASAAAQAACPDALDFQTRLLHSESPFDLCQAADQRAILLVNTASQCGYTPQFRQLETLYQRYQEAGLLVVAFPSDDFRQEYQDESRTAQVCFVNYGVSFPVLAPGAVTGEDANPVFRVLARDQEAPTWNFNKYLVSGQGEVLGHWPASAQPLGGELEAAIQDALAP